MKTTNLKIYQTTTSAENTQNKTTRTAYAYAVAGLSVVIVGCCVVVGWGLKRQFAERDPEIVVMPQPVVSNYMEPTLLRDQHPRLFDNAHTKGVDNALYDNTHGEGMDNALYSPHNYDGVGI